MSEHNMPDGPGWWAFEGHMNYGRGAASELIQTLVRVYWGTITSEWQTHSQVGYHPARHLVGTWTRVYMPWESPAPSPAPMPDEVRETLAGLINEAIEDVTSNRIYANPNAHLERLGNALEWVSLTWLDNQPQEPQADTLQEDK